MARTATIGKTAPGLFDREISNPELEEQIEAMLDAEEGYRAYVEARRPVKAAIELLQLKDGERVRIGRHVVEGKARAGGGFRVDPWSKVTVGKISELTND